MGEITVHREVSLDSPAMLEGLPGVGLVGKIAVDHVIQELDMQHYADVRVEGLPPVVLFRDGDYALDPPVRLFVDEERDLVALKSETLVSHVASTGFVDTVLDWVAARGATPVFTSGIPSQQQEFLFGVATGGRAGRLEAAGIPTPDGDGFISGPTGALLHEAGRREMPSLGFVIDTDPQFPDPAAAKRLIDQGIERVLDIEVDTSRLVEQAEEIKAQKEQLAQLIQEAEQHERTEAHPAEMYG